MIKLNAAFTAGGEIKEEKKSIVGEYQRLSSIFQLVK